MSKANPIRQKIEYELSDNSGEYTTKIPSEFLPVYLGEANNIGADIHYSHLQGEVYSVKITQGKKEQA